MGLIGFAADEVGCTFAVRRVVTFMYGKAGWTFAEEGDYGWVGLGGEEGGSGRVDH